MSGFTKLASSILMSSIWCADHVTLRVWIALLASCDADGFVEGTVPGFANLARVRVDEMRTALETLSSPDPDSRTPDNDGRRIEAVEGGWVVLNYSKYRVRRDPEERRQQVREAVRRHRAKKKCNQPVIKNDYVSPSKPKSEDRRQKSEKERRVHTLEFEEFWNHYPRRVGKIDARKAWGQTAQVRPPTDELIAKVDELALSADWREDNGRYVPYPATWLRAGGWEDEVR